MPMRLTTKEVSNGLTLYNLKPHEGEDAIVQQLSYYGAVKKLGQLEDLEDELGIDLVTLRKVLKDGIYDKRDGKHLFPELLWNTGINDWTLYCDDMEHADLYWARVYRLRECGKTWALTKEELQ